MANFKNRRPAELESAKYFFTYINKVSGDDIMHLLKEGKQKAIKLFNNISPEKWEFRYEENKWNIKQVLIHLIDSERVFAYRALRIARGDKTPLPGFEQDLFVTFCEDDKRSVQSIIDEYSSVRDASIVLFENFTEKMMNQSGTASENIMTPRAAAFIIAGHEIHHTEVIKERYLNENG